ncbi:hypothetical protein PENCOP_c001G08824 [Penicillium coprophilum]|uniref:Fungal-type protein kinase domain-containing protein n=1 Tax=Penicillium coprophilum TaxID=36646 RepID=A0A1V6V8E5_9EURO|nr:hypothetical protein PENCOP_c001G08824 [Penicillium coprophilum]
MIEEDCAIIKTTKGHRRVVKAFGLSPTRWWNKRQLNAKKTWSIPDHLACLWDDLDLITAREGVTHPLFPMRIESLLLALLADKIRTESFHPDGPLDSPHWSFRKRMFTPGMTDDQILAPVNIIDYVLWYGHCWELETNMIVMKTKSPVRRSWALIQNMSNIHHSRKLAGRNAVIYGVMTDGSKWVFIHLSNTSRYTIKVFSWDNERDRIIAQTQDIINQAVALHRKILSRSALPTPTVHQSSSCQIKEMSAPCNGSDDESGRIIEESTYEMDIEPLAW